MAPQRPVVRYHGGKWTLAPWIIGFFPPHRVYVEPFGGAGSVLLRKPASYAEVYNDLNGEIVNVFRILRDPEAAAHLRQIVNLTPFSREEFELAYQTTDDLIERARRTIARSYMGFGSASVNPNHATGFRASSKRSGTPPAADWYNWPTQVSEFTERLRRVVIENRRAEKVIAAQDDDTTLFYVDPPYPLSTRGNNRGVRQKYEYEMSDDDHRALAAVLRDVHGMVVLSGYPSPLYDHELYPDWQRFECPHVADGARPRTEVVWLNPACSRALDGHRAQGSLLDGAD